MFLWGNIKFNNGLLMQENEEVKNVLIFVNGGQS